MSSSLNEWTQALSTQGLVSIGTHSLFLSAAGPPRAPSQPVVIIEAGQGDSSEAWPAVMREISAFARVYSYNRAGYGQSESSSSPRTAENIASELSALLDATAVQGPYILVGHSYGGILTREFIASRQGDCAGLVLVDAVQEDDLKYEWPFPALMAVKGSLDRHEVIGLTATSKLTPDEWEAFVQVSAEDSANATAEKEFEELPGSVQNLELKKQFDTCAFGDRPVSIIKGSHVSDYEKIYEAGVRAGNGTPEQRETLKRFIEKIDEVWERNQKRQLDLSRKSRMVYANKSGHQVMQQQPELVAEEVKWILSLL